MDRILRVVIATLLLALPFTAAAQSVYDPSVEEPGYDEQKASLRTPPPMLMKKAAASRKAGQLKAKSAASWIPLDGSFHAVPRNDDGFYGPIALPFDFTFYGNTYNAVYINTNGTITFNNGKTTYETDYFPVCESTIAVYWGDVDTRAPGSGQVHYKVTATSLIVTWDKVGYYMQQSGLTNTFQAVLTNGQDPLLSAGCNLAFNYGDMQWATGEVGSGDGGAGGMPAWVGAGWYCPARVAGAQARSTDYTLIGNYYVLTGSSNNVNDLDNQSFCVGGVRNEPPVFAGLPTQTIELKVGETYDVTFTATGPEPEQEVNVSVASSAACKATHEVTPGSTATVKLHFEADVCNIGDSYFNMTASDNGDPSETAYANVYIRVAKLAQVITFPPPASPLKVSDYFTPAATSGSGLPVTYSVVKGPAIAIGGQIRMEGPGEVTIRAAQAGNQQYDAAVPVDITFCVGAGEWIGDITATSTTGCISNSSSFRVADFTGAEYTWTTDDPGAVISPSRNTAGVTWSTPGKHTVSVRYRSPCSETYSKTAFLEVNIFKDAPGGSFGDMLPANGSNDLNFPFDLTWGAFTNLAYYRIFIWPVGEQRPYYPTVWYYNTNSYTVRESNGVYLGVTYNWQIEAVNACGVVESPVQTFALRNPPELTVENVIAPPTAASGKPLTVSWDVLNSGPGETTDRMWTDMVTLVDATGSDAREIPLGAVERRQALPAGERYTATATFTIPQDVTGNWYVRVTADNTDAIEEQQEFNNSTFTTAPVAINLTAPPDLQVTALSAPASAGAGGILHVEWTVTNKGAGPTDVAAWTDKLYLSPTAAWDPNTAIPLGEAGRNGVLAPEEPYTMTRDITLSNHRVGRYYVIVKTDADNQVFEHDGEDNNDRSADAVCIGAGGAPGGFEGPLDVCADNPAVYKVSGITGAEFTWQVEGGTLTADGHTATVKWHTAGNHLISVQYAAGCNTAPSPPTARTVSVTTVHVSGNFSRMLPAEGATDLTFPLPFSWVPPVNARYYDLYVWPAGEQRPEYPIAVNLTDFQYRLPAGEIHYGVPYKWQVVARNTCNAVESPVQTFTARKLPDLVAPEETLQPPAEAFSGQTITVSWVIRNIGEGGTLNGQWNTGVYLSKDRQLSSEDVRLGAVPNVSALGAGASHQQQASFLVPDGVFGTYYTLLAVNDFSGMPEATHSNNMTASAAATEISLTTPPDLQVTSIIPPNFAFSGQPVKVVWTVTNKGNGLTRETDWADQVFISRNKTFIKAEATLLGTQPHQGALRAGAAYTTEGTFILPENAFGTHYLHVITDPENRVYEHAREDNNGGVTDAVEIVLTPPADLIVQDVTAPAATSNAARVRIAWQVKNAGGSATGHKTWWDAIYLSATPELDTTKAMIWHRKSRPKALAPGDTYKDSADLIVPTGITGPYYVFVRTDDRNDIYEYTYDANNATSPQYATAIHTPDLTVSDLTLPAEGVTGNTVTVRWQLHNNGAGAVNAGQLMDQFLLSTAPEYDAAQCLPVVLRVTQTGIIQPGATLPMEAVIKLPEPHSGSYYGYLYTDQPDDVFETANGNNITRSAGRINIARGPWADLRVTNIIPGASATAGYPLRFRYTVVNRGEKAAADSMWTDRIYYDLAPVWDAATARPLRAQLQSRNIGKDGSYEQTVELALPPRIGDSTYYFYVWADAADNVYEHTEENNNILRSAAVNIGKYPPVDLLAANFTAPLTGRSGTTVQVSWSARNLADVPTLAPEWQDAVYLSADSILDSRDTLVKTFKLKETLRAGQTYEKAASVKIPDGLQGTYYWLLAADHLDAHFDTDRSNNIAKVRPQGGAAQPVVITATPPADFVMEQYSIPDTATAGQPLRISWTVYNRGVGATPFRNWTDKVYLSRDAIPGEDDYIIATHAADTLLQPGEQYTVTKDALIPSHLSGNYLVIIRADANNDIYENGAEANNVEAYTTVSVAPLSDLVAEQISVPVSAQPGDTLHLSWILRNQGENPAKGYLRQGIYLSADDKKDAGDILLESPVANIGIPPGQAERQQFSVALKGAVAGSYHILVHADVLNNIAESTDDNNIAASTQTLLVTVPELPLDTKLPAALPGRAEKYYRVEIPDSLSGETLLVKLTGEAANGANELYIRHGEIPTRAVHDAAGNLPYEGNQEVIIPELKSGTYFLLVYGNRNAAQPVPVTLEASILRFQLRGVAAAKGSNKGQVTLEIKGSKFNTLTGLALKDQDATLPAAKLDVKTPTRALATFDLQGRATGVYSLVAQSSKGESAALENAFTIISGEAGKLVMHVERPATLRANGTGAMTVHFTNTGNTDLIRPVIRLTAAGGAPVGLTMEALSARKTSLVLTAAEKGGPDGVLRPGATGSITVYTRATAQLTFVLIKDQEK